jgi:hypothetical protein
MRKPSRAVLIVAILCFAFRTSGDHPWFEIRSPHFSVICNASEKDGRDAAVDLERTRTVMIKSLPSLSHDPSAPLVVFVTADDSALAALTPKSWEGKQFGIVQRGRDHIYIVMRIGSRISTEFLAKYDYAALLAGLNFYRAPLWFRAGVAEFFGVSEIAEDQAKIGMPSYRFVQRLREDPRRLQATAMIPLPRFFVVTTNSPEYRDPDLRWAFAAQSWGLFHYLILGDNGEHKPQREHYLQLLVHGKKQLDAAKEAFGDLGKTPGQIRAILQGALGLAVCAGANSPQGL